MTKICLSCGEDFIVPEKEPCSGMVIDDFAIQASIGKGATAAVYLCHQLSLDRLVALKVLLPTYAEDPETHAEFLKEARAAARLSHPSIVQAYAVGEKDGFCFFAMEYVEGGSLKDLMKEEGPVSEKRLLKIAEQVCNALDFAWEKHGMVHRDIKPENIMLKKGDEVKLADLGLAMRGGQGSEDEIAGTPHYIAPEGILREYIDCRSDIYSLGATLYHAATGRFPYNGKSPAEVFKKHLSEPLNPAHEVNKTISIGTSTLFTAMMAKRPEDRPANFEKLIQEIRNTYEGLSPTVMLSPMLQMPRKVDETNPAFTGAAQIEFKSGQKSDPFASKNEEEGNGDTSATIPYVEGHSTGAKPKKSDGLLSPVAIGLFVVSCILIGLFLLLGDKLHKETEEELGKPGLVESKSAADTFIENLSDTAAPEATLKEAAALFPNLETSEEKTVLLNAVRPFLEKHLEPLRKEKHHAVVTEWKDEAENISEKRRLRKLEEERRRAAAKKKRSEKKAKDMLVEHLSKQQKELRIKALELCREHNYADAKLLFAGMAASDQKKFRNWANDRIEVIEAAQKMFEMVAESRGKLKGMDIRVAEIDGLAYVQYINSKEVEVSEDPYGQKGKTTLSWNSLSETQMWKLCEALWPKEKSKKELTRKFCFYLMARGQFLSEAEKRLVAFNDKEMDSHIKEIETLRKINWEALLDTLKEKTKHNDRASVRRILNYMRAYYPEEWKKDEHRIREMLK